MVKLTPVTSLLVVCHSLKMLLPACGGLHAALLDWRTHRTWLPCWLHTRALCVLQKTRRVLPYNLPSWSFNKDLVVGLFPHSIFPAFGSWEKNWNLTVIRLFMPTSSMSCVRCSTGCAVQMLVLHRHQLKHIKGQGHWRSSPVRSEMVKVNTQITAGREAGGHLQDN